jgi:acetyl-CoA carboxylase carboxyltransferase component
VAEGDEDALQLARTYLSFFPQHSGAAAPRREGPDAKPRLLDDLVEIIPPNDRRPYDMHDVVDRLVDEDSFLEIQPGYGKSLIVGLAYLGGRAIAIVANNPARNAGAVDSDAAIKATDFLEHIGNFGHPVVFLGDNPGVMAGTKAEREGILKWGGKMFRAQRRLKNAKFHVTVRKSFGFGAVTMAQNPHDLQTLSYALPGVTMGAMPAASGGRSAKLDAEAQAQAEKDQASGPYRMADHLTYDDIIGPAELRNKLIDGLELLEVR